MERIKNIIYKIKEEDSPALYEFFLFSIALDFVDSEKNTSITEKVASEEEIL
ncbi:hypothetical protein HMPREF1049_1011 [Fusobacterium necrophorum subsp. funduliforme ATCC 51357]|uniref:Uncharacterized protein n=1 Tax=Fusobacterium gonidiaformans 3-1-5R TaxID=469605 RepID=E5BI51_9FUSO|nr:MULTISPECIES: hypothetical protein [Fusobacterium]EFS22174.1 hypothetical protein FSBG_01671 [Fusobacterium gonidiaformans 3-1-5R]EFS22960.1 hypothetical protein FSEG_00567 [Fusobacterium necrophorum D12]EIJ68659.1 hypothetical protein HMPREF1049_1011 [Fusobacterium necrophorum subsp. funduliforme ATCC 51357]MDK4495008.1 hypothetical protein [Fusobacterium necrophorum]